MSTNLNYYLNHQVTYWEVAAVDREPELEALVYSECLPLVLVCQAPTTEDSASARAREPLDRTFLPAKHRPRAMASARASVND